MCLMSNILLLALLSSSRLTQYDRNDVCGKIFKAVFQDQLTIFLVFFYF